MWTQRKILIENQAKLIELLEESSTAEIEIVDVPLSIKAIETVILKEEPMDLVDIQEEFEGDNEGDYGTNSHESDLSDEWDKIEEKTKHRNKAPTKNIRYGE